MKVVIAKGVGDFIYIYIYLVKGNGITGLSVDYTMMVFCCI
jgi:hypothetical protein